MARGEAPTSSACTREGRFPATGRGTRDAPSGSAELSRRAHLQPAAVAGAGGGSRRRRSSGRCAEFAGHRSSCSGFEPNYDPDGGLSDSDSLEDSSASTDDENVSRKKKMLEDALFGFFKKEAIKSLKRDFSKFCHNANFSSENKRLKVSGVGRDAFSVYSSKYFSEIINRMPIGRKDVISKYGFEYLLKYERTEVPSHFVRWIVGCVDTVSSQIIIVDEKIIELSKHSVHLVLGLPNSGAVAMPNKESGRNFILSRFNLAELPNITYFGNLLMSSEELSEEDTFICFMVVAMSCFLFPSSSDQIHTDFLSILEDPSATRGFDMCFLVYEWILSGINKYVLFGRETGRKPKVFDFCAYCLAVLYLDKLDFGVRVVEQGVPRIIAWKGNSIKHFSELDRKRSNLFGRRQFKKHDDFEADVGARHGAPRSMNVSLHFKENLLSTFANVLPVQIINGIFESTHSVNTKQSSFQNVQEETTLNVLKFLSEYRGSSLFGVAGQENFQKTGAAFKQSTSISIEKEKTHSKSTSATGVGTHTEIDEKLKKGSNVIEHTHRQSIDDIARSATASKHQPAEASNKFTSLEHVIDSRLSAVQKNLHDATGYHAATPECVITKIVEPNDGSAPGLPIAKKVKARVCNLMHRERELSLLNTYPAGLKDRSSFFQYSVQHTEGTFVSPTGRTGTKDVIGSQLVPFQAKQSSYLMINKMSPLTRTNLSKEFSEKDCQKDNTVENAAHAANQVLKCNNKLGTKKAPIPVVDLSPQPPASGAKRISNVNIISPTSFGVRQSQLAKNADALYNNMLAPVANRQHQTVTSAEDITYMRMKSAEHIIIDEIDQEPATSNDAKDELIILQEKKLLILPFKQNKRFPVSEADCKNYNTIIELAYTKGVQRTYALMFPRVHCSYISLGQCLMPTGHMDNFLLPCFCRKFFEDCHPTISGRHHFFPHIGENILNYRSSEQLKMIAISFVGAASASRRKRLDNSLRLFFPIVIQGHWIVFAVDFHYKLFAFLDSYYDKDSHFHTSIREKLIDNFINLWEIIFQTKEHIFRIFKRMYPHVPKQDNGNDCGIFAVKFMEIWEPAMDLRKCFSQADITHIRIQYMNQLYFWNKNSTDKSLVTNFSLEGDFVGNPAR